MHRDQAHTDLKAIQRSISRFVSDLRLHKRDRKANFGSQREKARRSSEIGGGDGALLPSLRFRSRSSPLPLLRRR